MRTRTLLVAALFGVLLTTPFIDAATAASPTATTQQPIVTLADPTDSPSDTSSPSQTPTQAPTPTPTATSTSTNAPPKESCNYGDITASASTAALNVTAAGGQATATATLHNTTSKAFKTSFIEFDIAPDPKTSSPGATPSLAASVDGSPYVGLPLSWQGGSSYWASPNELLPLSAHDTATLHFRVTFKAGSKTGRYVTQLLVFVQSCNKKVGGTSAATFVFSPTVVATPSVSPSVTPSPSTSVTASPSLEPTSSSEAFGFSNAPAAATTPSAALDASLASDSSSGHATLIFGLIGFLLVGTAIVVIIAIRRSRRREDDDVEEVDAADQTFGGGLGYAYDEELPRRDGGRRYGGAPDTAGRYGDSSSTYIFGTPQPAGSGGGYPEAYPEPRRSGYGGAPSYGAASAYGGQAAYGADPGYGANDPGYPPAPGYGGAPPGGAGYSDPAYPDSGYPDSGYGNSGYGSSPGYGGAPSYGEQPGYDTGSGYGGEAPGYAGGFTPSPPAVPQQRSGPGYRGPAYDADPGYPPEPAYQPQQAYPQQPVYPSESMYPSQTAYPPAGEYDPRWGAEPADPAATGDRYEESPTARPSRHGHAAGDDAYEPDASIQGWQGDGYAGYQDESWGYHPQR